MSHPSTLVLPGALALACSSNSVPDLSRILPEPCADDPCVTTDGRAASGDYRIALSSGAVLSMHLDQSDGIQVLDAGQVVLRDDGTELTLRALALSILEFEAETNEGTVHADLDLSLTAPVKLIREPNGRHSIPLGTDFTSCLVVDGRRDHGSTSLRTEVNLDISTFDELFSIDGTLPWVIHLGETQCQRLEGTLAGSLSGSAWETVE